MSVYTGMTHDPNFCLSHVRHRTTSYQTIQACVNYCGGRGNMYFHYDTTSRECACFNNACSSLASAATYSYGSRAADCPDSGV